MRRLALLVAVAALPLLAACGGGGGNAPTVTGGEPPTLEEVPIAAVDTIFLGDPISFFNGQLVRGHSSCLGLSCDATIGDSTARIDFRGLGPSAVSDRDILEQRSRNGVSLAHLQLDRFAIDAWGAWGFYSLAAIVHQSVPPTGPNNDLLLSLSGGAASGSSPVSGSASWSGIAVARELNPSHIGVRLGYDAELELDFDSSTLGLTFVPYPVSGLGSDAALQVLSWNDVPVADGAFAATGLDGRFYGPSHEEAGGIFERDQIAGAFVLRRQ